MRNALGLHSPSRAVIGACQCRRCRPYRYAAAAVIREGFAAGVDSGRAERLAALQELLQPPRPTGWPPHPRIVLSPADAARVIELGWARAEDVVVSEPPPGVRIASSP